MRSSLRDLASVAEIVASIGVIVSLIFVGLQLSEGNREARAATNQVVIQSEMDMVTVFIEHAGTWDKVLTGARLEEGEETRRAIVLLQLSMLETANRYRQYTSGYLDRNAWEGSLEILPAIKALPIYAMWRASFGGRGQDKDFLALLDSIPAASDQPGQDD